MEIKDLEKCSIAELENLILEKKKVVRPNNPWRNALWERRHQLNRSFDFNDKENIDHILRINQALLRAMHDVYDKVAHIKQDFDRLIADGELVYKDYEIEGQIYFQIDWDEEMSRDRQLLDILTSEANACWSVRASDGMEMEDRIDCMLDNLNWDIELLLPIRKWGIHICYAMHAFFVDDSVLSLEDLKHLKENDIYTEVKIYL